MALRLVVSTPSDGNPASEVLTVLGGKSSCRRKFVVNVQLVDNNNKVVRHDMAVAASLAFAHDYSPVVGPEKPVLAESPLFIAVNGVEYPAEARTTRLIAGRATLKLAISLLSSKCDNRLFVIQLEAKAVEGTTVGTLPPPAYSSPIRSISRKRARTGAAVHGFINLECPPLASPASSSEGDATAPSMRNGAPSRGEAAGQFSADQGRAKISRSELVGSHTGPLTSSRPEVAAGQMAPPVDPTWPSIGSPQPGAFKPFASVGSFRLPPPAELPATEAKEATKACEAHAQDSASTPSSPVKETTVGSGPSTPVGLDVNPSNGLGGVAQPLLNLASLEEEERALQYMEASLVEVGRELQRRRAELTAKRKRYEEEEQKMRSLLQQQPWLVPAIHSSKAPAVASFKPPAR